MDQTLTNLNVSLKDESLEIGHERKPKTKRQYIDEYKFSQVLQRRQ